MDPNKYFFEELLYFDVTSIAVCTFEVFKKQIFKTADDFRSAAFRGRTRDVYRDMNKVHRDIIYVISYRLTLILMALGLVFFWSC